MREKEKEESRKKRVDFRSDFHTRITDASFMFTDLQCLYNNDLSYGNPKLFF